MHLQLSDKLIARFVSGFRQMDNEQHQRIQEKIAADLKYKKYRRHHTRPGEIDFGDRRFTVSELSVNHHDRVYHGAGYRK
jgi:hypothetical protein